MHRYVYIHVENRGHFQVLFLISCSFSFLETDSLTATWALLIWPEWLVKKNQRFPSFCIPVLELYAHIGILAVYVEAEGINSHSHAF